MRKKMPLLLSKTKFVIVLSIRAGWSVHTPVEVSRFIFGIVCVQELVAAHDISTKIHAAKLIEPEFESEPTGQCVQFAAPAVEYVLLGQIVGLNELWGQYDPAGQITLEPPSQ